MSIFDKIKKQARKLMPKELSGIAQAAAPFVAGATGNPLLGAALSYLGQARSGRGDINPLKIAMSSAPGLQFGKDVGIISGTEKNIPFGFAKTGGGNTLRNIFTGQGQGNRDGILNIGDFKGGNYLDKLLYGVDGSGIIGSEGDSDFIGLANSAPANLLFRGELAADPFESGKDLSGLKLGTLGLSLYSFIDANKQIKTAEEAAAAVEAQMIADGITNQSIIDAATEEAINIFSQLSKADFNLANGGRIGFARGTSEEGIGSLDTGAESIMYEGTDGARSPEQTETEQQNLQVMGLPKNLTLEDAIKTFEMSIGRPPKGLEEVLEFFKNRKLSGGTPLPEDPTKPINPFGPKPMKDGITQMAAAGGRMGFMYGSDMGGMGGLSSLQTQASDVTPPGMELDLRGGGFIPIGKAEKADDVPARVSKNEFVFTADAVKAAGGGSVNEGAKKMYDTMKQLESQVG